MVNNQTGFEPKVFFSGVNVEPKKFAFTPAQACDLASCARHEFGEKHFILLVEADGELFVLYVYRGGNHICARIAEFSDEQRWYQKNLRIVLRKQEPVVA